jgi:hypothetical protein
MKKIVYLLLFVFSISSSNAQLLSWPSFPEENDAATNIVITADATKGNQGLWAGTWYDYFDGTTLNATGVAQSITLQPGEYHVYHNRNVVSSIATPVPPINPPENNLFVRMVPNPVLQSVVIEM